MKIQLGKFKAYHARSEETLNFTATILVDGKKVGTVENDGRGGSCMEHFDDPKVRAEVQAHIIATSEDKSEFAITMDYFFATLADEAVQAQEAAKDARRRNRFAMDAKAKGLHAFIAEFMDKRGAFAMLWMTKASDLISARATADAKATMKRATVVKVEQLA
jgi:hypothetical protein